MKKYMIAFIFLFPVTVYGTSWDEANEDAKAFAKEMNETMVNPSATETDPESVPGYEGRDVPQTEHYGSGLGIENEAAANVSTNDTAEFINSGRNDRPGFNIRRDSDPMFKRHDAITDSSVGLSQTYGGCIDLPVGDEDITEYETMYCEDNAHRDEIEFTCNRNMSVECSNSNAGNINNFQFSDFSFSGDPGMEAGGSGRHWRYGSTQANRSGFGGECRFYENEVRFYVDDLSLVGEFQTTAITYDDWLDIRLNGELMFRGIGPNVGTHVDGTFPCEYGQTFAHNNNVDLRPALREGWNTITVINQVYGMGHAYFQVQSSRIHGCDESVDYTVTCEGGKSRQGAQFRSRQCSSGRETRIVEGFEITRCWEYEETYTKLGDPYYVEDELCSQLEAIGCGRTGSECLATNGRYCQRNQIRFSCPNEVPARHVSLCGDQLVCPDGECTSDVGQNYEDASDDFLEAATALAVAGEVSNQFDHDDLSVFEGSDKKCKNQTLGFANCCSSTGWGVGLGLTQCDTEERQLGMAREAEQAIYVGQYTSGGILDRRRYQVYCTYPSKLARIIVEQANAQLGRGYGTPREPVCSGFTPEELEALDFETMDLSEFHADVEASTDSNDVPGADDLTQPLIESINQRFGGE